MIVIYSIIILLFSGWISWQKKQHLSNLLGTCLAIALVGFLITLYSQPFALESKMGIMAVSMIGLAAFSALYSMIKSSLARIILLGSALWLAPKMWLKADMRPMPERDSLAQDGELMIKIAPDHYESIVKQIAKLGIKARSAFDMIRLEQTELDDYLIIDVPDHHTLLDEVHHIENIEGVKKIVYNSMYKIDSQTGSLPQKSNKAYSTNDPMRPKQWHLDHIRIDELFDYIKKNNISPRKQAQLYFLDSGVDAGHRDLNIHPSQAAVQNDGHGHGTHCMGVASAKNNNNKGISAIIPNERWVQTHAIKVLSDSGYGSRQKAIQGIITAVDQGADVISMSMGALSLFNARKVYNEAIDYALSQGTIVVAAAGNSNSDAEEYSPANADHSITVTAITPSNDRAAFSNTGNNTKYVVAAPGTDILSTVTNNQYEAQTGTSMAAPQVSATVALMKAIDPSIDTERAFRILERTGLETNDLASTGKLIYPYRAIRAVYER